MPWLDRLATWCEDRVALPGDGTEERTRKRVQVMMTLASLPTIGAWGLAYVALGHPRVALLPAAYVAISLLMLVHFFRTRRHDLFRPAHILLVMALPYCLHWYLGGMVGASAAILWSGLGPVAALMFYGPRGSVPFFMTYLALLGVAMLREGPRAGAAEILTPAQISGFFFFNVAGTAIYMYVSMAMLTAKLDREHAKNQRLLLSILPAPIAERLKREPGVIADHFPAVTVVFADLVGFTPLAATLRPEQLVTLLDEIFSAFDAQCEKLGLEKIKTIGDAYMVVAGLPEPCPDHALRAARMATAMVATVESIASGRGIDLAVRVGMHSGEVVAGIIGRSKFSYDLWGDTVNLASRMESHGLPGRIHVTGAVKDALAGAWPVEERGPVTLKGKGELVTWWLGSPGKGPG